MSLDIWLTREKYVSYDKGTTYTVENETVYDCNITHNLGKMAEAAGIYDALWRPYRLREHHEFKDYDEEMEFEGKQTIYAKEVIDILEKGLNDMLTKPDYYKKFDSENGWGIYDHFIPFITKYLEACIQFPETIINVDR